MAGSFWASHFWDPGVVEFFSGQKRESRYIIGKAEGERHTFLPYQDAPHLSLSGTLFCFVRLGSLTSGILRGPVKWRGANMPDPLAGGQRRGAPPEVSQVSPACQGGETGLRCTSSDRCQTGIPTRVTPPPRPAGIYDPPGRGGSSLRPYDLRSALDAFRSDMLADGTWP